MDELSKKVVVVSGSGPIPLERGFTQKNHVFSGNSPAQAISAIRGSMPVGTKIIPHYHPYEELVFVLSGQARTNFGDNLEYSVNHGAGDFLYMPADIIHFPENIGTEPVEYIVIRACSEEVIHLPGTGPKYA